MERVELIPGLSRQEAEALAYFAMGVASEGSIGGRNVAYQLSFAGSIRNGRMTPLGNSGFSIGTLQTDLGQHPAVAGELTAAYRAWSNVQEGPKPIQAGDENGWAELERLLARDGRAIRGDGGRSLAPGVREGIDALLGSNAGIGFIHARDMAQVERLLRSDPERAPSALHAIGATSLYRDASADDRIRLAAVFLKLENQSGAGIYPGLVRRIEQGRIETFDALKDVIDSRDDYVSSGMRHTLSGVDTYLALRGLSADSPLTEASRKVLQSALTAPTGLEREGDDSSPSRAEYHAIKTMFMQPDATVPFLRAVDRGSGFTHGRAAPRQTGFFVAGNDFAYWDGDGIGHARIGSEWQQIARDEMRRVDAGPGRVDLLRRTADGEEPLLEIDRRAPALRPGPGAMVDPQLRGRIEDLRDSLGMLGSPPMIDRITASLMHARSVAGMRRVQHIAAGGDRLYAWDDDPRNPAARWLSVSLEDAVQTPVDVSLGALARLDGRDDAQRHLVQGQAQVHEPAAAQMRGLA